MEKTLTDDLFPIHMQVLTVFLSCFYVVYCYYFLRVEFLLTRKYAQPKTTVNIQFSVFNFKSLKVLASTKLPQRSDDSTIPVVHTSLFPPPKICIHLAAHNVFLCNPPTSLYYTGNFSMCTVNFVERLCFFISFLQLLRFRIFYNFQKRWILR